MSDSSQPDPNELITQGSINLSSVTGKLITSGSLNLTSPADAESERQNKNKDQELERKQKTINFWLKDVAVFILALLLVTLIDIYGFTILIDDKASESKTRFALAVLTSTVTSLLSYLLGRASK